MNQRRIDVLISVIVPVYNAEEYIDRCVSSILCNEEKNFEILLIDDGSTDGSGKKCDDWSLKDARIRVFHKKNGGVSSARNIGLDNALGDWVAFIDADDEVSPQYLSIPKELLGCDVILKSFIERTNEADLEFRVSRTEYHGTKSIVRWFIRGRHNALWDKIIRRDIIGDIRFDSTISIGEDLLFFAAVLPKVSCIATCECGHYIYIRRPLSAMSKSNGKNRLEGYIFNSEKLIALSDKSSRLYHCKTLAAQLYIPLVRNYINLLTPVQRRRFKQVYGQINIFRLPCLTLKERVKFIWTLFLFKIRTRNK